MAELADAVDSKSTDASLVGSTPTPGTSPAGEEPGIEAPRTADLLARFPNGFHPCEGQNDSLGCVWDAACGRGGITGAEMNGIIAGHETPSGVFST